MYDPDIRHSMRLVLQFQHFARLFAILTLDLTVDERMVSQVTITTCSVHVCNFVLELYQVIHVDG